MRIALRTTAIALLSTDARPRGVTDNTAVIGTWEGESKCTVPDSPCHDEHVVFRLADKNDSTVKLDAYKIVQGSPELMGTLVCRYHADQSNLSCTGNTRQPDDWQFHVSVTP